MMEDKLQNIHTLEHILCEDHRPVMFFCTNRDCHNNFIICGDQNCLCSKKHIKCKFTVGENLVSKINSKITQMSNENKEKGHKIIGIYDQLIESLSRQRQHMEQCIEYYGLSTQEVLFINCIKENSLVTYSKLEFNNIVERIQSVHKLEPSTVYQFLQESWREKETNFKTLFDFKNTDYYTIQKDKSCHLQSSDNNHLRKKLLQIPKKQLQELTITNLYRITPINQECWKIICQFNNLKKLSINAKHLIQSELRMILIAFPEVQYLTLQEAPLLDQSLYCSILSLPNVKKLCMSQDTKHSLQKIYEDYFYFDKKIFVPSNVLSIPSLDKNMDSLEYWEQRQGKVPYSQLKNITQLHLSEYNSRGSEKNVHFFIGIQQMPKLIYLNLSRLSIFFSQEQRVWKYFPSLRCIIMYECRDLTGRDIMQISKHIPNLESLVLDFSIEGYFDYSAISNLRKLKVLSLETSETQKNNNPFQSISSLFTQIRNKRHQKIQQELVEGDWLGKLSNLEFLNLKNNVHYKSDWLISIKKLKKLKFLAINEPSQSIQRIMLLKDLSHLKSLIWVKAKNTNLLSDLLSHLRSLQKLSIQQLNLQDSFLELIVKTCPSLIFFRISLSRYSSGSSLKDLPKLNFLRVNSPIGQELSKKLQRNGVTVWSDEPPLLPPLPFFQQSDEQQPFFELFD